MKPKKGTNISTSTSTSTNTSPSTSTFLGASKRMKCLTPHLGARDFQSVIGYNSTEDTSPVPTQKGFLRTYDWDFWCRWNPMDWCYGDAGYNDPRREITPSFQEFCENMLLREELEYQAAIMLTLI